MTRHRTARRGILLLMVLSLLVLFVLVGITFVVVATQHAKDAKIASRVELVGDDPIKELDNALMRLTRGSDDRMSLPARHNLLRDLYGEDSFSGIVTLAASADQQRQFIRIQFVNSANLTPAQWQARKDYFNGGLLTMIDGRAAGISTRVVSFNPPNTPTTTNSTGEIYIVAFDDILREYIPRVGERFVLNGMPFNGTGEGYNAGVPSATPPRPATGKLDSTLADIAASGVLPQAFISESSFIPVYGDQELALLPFRPLIASGLGDGDESWDAADYQNMFLARQPLLVPPTGVPEPIDPLIPSFHRPELVNYWMRRLTNGTTEWDNPAFNDLRRWIIARPLPQDHPFFTGSNPAFTAPVIGFTSTPVNKVPVFRYATPYDTDNDGIPNAYDADEANDGTLNDTQNNDGLIDVPIVRGPWDVDNDRDGVADSIWVDLGDRVKVAPDGRLYKPLYAILCVDQDGRLNLNAHGADDAFFIPRNGGFPTDPLDSDGVAIGAGQPLLNLTLGQGYGPAEVRLDLTFQDPGFAIGNLINFQSLLLDDRDGLSPGSDQTGETPQAMLQDWGVPLEFSKQHTTANRVSLFMTPPDMAGVGAVYTDYRGQPRYHLHQQPIYRITGSPRGAAMVNAPRFEPIDDPYERNLVMPQGGDSLFSPAELEQLRRIGDLDTRAFPSRLLSKFSQSIPPNPNRSNIADVQPRQLGNFTTASFSNPAPPVMVPDTTQRSALLYRPATPFSSIGLSGYLRERLIASGFGSSLTPAQREIALIYQVNQMLPRELRTGQRLDLNRLFGNGRDDNNNGVVDEPLELAWVAGSNEQPLWLDTNTPGRANWQALVGSNGLFGYDDAAKFADANSPPTGPNGFYSRQQFARHLYCLAMMVMDDQFRVPSNPSATPTPLQQQELTARRIAQWAVNVVDFRDPDSIMTPFEYDITPFDANGWSIDDDYRTGIANDKINAPADNRRIVWGCESPELLITESLAFHDRRVRDTKYDDNAASKKKRFPSDNRDGDMDPSNGDDAPDEDLDQIRIPQGSLFLEFYAAGNSSLNNLVPTELSGVNPGTGAGDETLGLDLAKIAIDPVTNAQSPVWRVVLTDPPANSNADEQWTMGHVLQKERTFFDPNDPTTVTSTPAQRLTAETQRGVAGVMASQPNDRIIVFTQNDPVVAGMSVPAGAYYYQRNNAASLVLPPGRYAVVGPRRFTHFGSKERPNPDSGPEPPVVASTERIVLDPTAASTPIVPLQIIAAANPPAAWTPSNPSVPQGIGINISEPLPTPAAYYPEPKYNDPATAGEPVTRSFYLDLSNPTLSPVPDVPLDSKAGSPLASDPRGRTTGTRPNFRVALLQRLADPTRAWDAVVNPYITVDTQPIDLTVFNGEDASFNHSDPSSKGPSGWLDPDNPQVVADTAFDPDDDPTLRADQNSFGAYYFTSRERGRDTEWIASGVNSVPNVWNPISTGPRRKNPASATFTNSDYQNRDLNDEYFGIFPRRPISEQAAAAGLAAPIRPTFGLISTQPGVSLNFSYGAPLTQTNPTAASNSPRFAMVPGNPTGTPSITRPFPWITWNNRPFTNPLELMLVPTSAPWRLPYEARRAFDVTSAPGSAVPPMDDAYQNFQAPFVHLLNFYYNQPNATTNNKTAEFQRLFDLVDVTSPFVGTQQWLSPALNIASLGGATGLQELFRFLPPFNKISRFRDPGKININTIPGELVWRAVMGESPLTASASSPAPWNRVLASLWGGPNPGTGKIWDRPAWIANPVRSAASAELMPLANLQQTKASEATLFRSDPTNSAKPLIGPSPQQAYADSNTNPFYRYQHAARLGNMLTTQSNVYAVWVTVGYFEVQPWNPVNPLDFTLPPIVDYAHPDGYQLTSEMGNDTGKVVRHRAFYIIDRSIPVAFEPGENHNVEKTVVLRRYLE